MPNLPSALACLEVGGTLDEGEPGVLVDGADPIAEHTESLAGAFEDGDGRGGRGGAALDVPVDVLAAHRERADRIDDDGLVVNAIVIEFRHA